MKKKKQKKSEENYPTTGHEWDGIREYDKPMPRWWLNTLYLTIVWAIGYTIAYPAWPLINGATPGLLGWSSRGDVAAEIAKVNAQNAEIETKLLETPMSEIGADAELANFANAGGAAVFRTYCAQCHGEGAQGAKGYPNLQDDDWLWGGEIDTIHTTITHGIRYEADDDTRFSEMPKFGEFLEPEEITSLAHYVRSLSGLENDAAQAETGKELFAENCAACHGDDGTGDREQGAPNLTDAIWLYGSDQDTVEKTITYARFGVMPAWTGRISDAQIKQVAYFIHELGGGE